MPCHLICNSLMGIGQTCIGKGLILLLQLSIVTGSENLAKEDQVMAELIPNTTLQHTDNNNVGGQLTDTMYNNLYVTGGKTNNKIYNYIETGIHRDAMWMQLHTSNGGV